LSIKELSLPADEIKHNRCSLTRTFAGTGRQPYDDLLNTDDGWELFETDQDASYFGVWINRQQLIVVTYCEGDLHIVRAPDAAAFDAEIAEMESFYQRTADG